MHNQKHSEETKKRISESMRAHHSSLREIRTRVEFEKMRKELGFDK